MYNNKNKPEIATRPKQITYNTETDVFLRLPFSIQLIDTENKKGRLFQSFAFLEHVYFFC